jgi:uncharacterized membrane protein
VGTSCQLTYLPKILVGMPRSHVSDRALILHWAEKGIIPATQVEEALAAASVTPSYEDWRSFVDRLLLWSGTTFLGVAAIFFVAFNWNDLGRFAKFGLAEALIVISTIAFAKLGPDRISAKAALLFSALAMGALLALVGQTYQTGADPWQLFASWSVLILPWVAVGRFSGLWMLWIAIVNVAIALYFVVFGGLFGFVVSTERLFWTLFVFDTAALAIWEHLATRVIWLNERWAPRLLALACGVIITGLAMNAIADQSASRAAFVIYPLWLGTVYTVYRYRTPDLFVLSGACLSVIVTITTFLSKHMLRRGDDGGAFLLIALAVVGMASAAAMWLRWVAVEEME